MTVVDFDDGCQYGLAKVSFPWPMSNRVYITTHYRMDMEDGSFMLLSSGQNNTELHEKYKDIIGKDIIAQVRYTMWKVEPVKDQPNKCNLSSV